MRLTAAALAVLALAAGCGTTGDSDFSEKALAICEDTNGRIRGLGTPESYAETQLYARRAEDAVADEIDELNDLSPPADVQDPFDLYLVTLEERQRLLGRMADAADANSMLDVQTVGSEIDALGKTAREQATAAGIAECEPG